MQISQLNIYPVKSLGGISVQESRITTRGLQYDRRWMLVNEEGKFLTQRQFAQMALLKVELTETELSIFHSQHIKESVKVPFEFEPIQKQEVIVWDDTCQAVRISNEIDEWFSEQLKHKCHLVYMPDDSERKVELKYAQNGEITSFSDGYPFLLIGQTSLDDLNSRLEEPVPMNRFRPNIVFTGAQAFEEDTLHTFRIGKILFTAAKPCGRCIITTINQDTAEGGKEPLKTLADYRKVDNKILFGQNLLHKGEGTIAVGDKMENLIYKEKK